MLDGWMENIFIWKLGLMGMPVITMEFKCFVLFLTVSIQVIFSSPLFTSIECGLYLDDAFICNPVMISARNFWKFFCKEVFQIITEVSRMHGLIYSPKVQNFCIITYNLFTRLVGIVPNEGFACFMMTVKDIEGPPTILSLISL